MKPLSFVSQVKKLYPSAEVRDNQKNARIKSTPTIVLYEDKPLTDNPTDRKLIAIILGQSYILNNKTEKLGVEVRMNITVIDRMENRHSKSFSGKWKSVFSWIINILRENSITSLRISGVDPQNQILFSTYFENHSDLQQVFITSFVSKKHNIDIPLDTPLPRI